MHTSYGAIKQWDDDAFGVVKSHEAQYFRRELSAAGIRPGSRVLELGFGNGSFLAYARDQGYLVEGVELEQARVALARRNGFAAYPTTELDRLSGYDLLVAFDVLEHLSADELHSLFKSTHRLLNPNGQFLARFPNGQSPFGLVNQHGDITHRTAIGAEMVRQLAIVHNLEIVAIRNPRLWLHKNPVIAALRILQRAIGKCLEVAVSIAFYSRVEPMNPNLVVHLRRR